MSKPKHNNGKDFSGEQNEGRHDKRNKPTRKERILAEISARNPEQLTKKVDYTNSKAVPAIQKLVVESGDDNLMARKLFDRDYTGLVRFDDMIFKKEKHHKDDFSVPAIYVYQADRYTKLEGLSGCKTFISIGQLCNKEFKTKLTNPKEVENQRRMYDYLHGLFKSEGLLSTPKKHDNRPAKVHKPATESFKTLPTECLQQARLGFYDMKWEDHELVIKLFKEAGNYKIAVAKISENHPLKSNNISVGFAIPSECFYKKHYYKYDEATTAFVKFLHGVVNGVMEVPENEKGKAVASQFQFSDLPPGAEVVSGNIYDRKHRNNQQKEV